MLICVSGVGSSGAKALDPGRKDVRKLLTEVHTQNEKKKKRGERNWQNKKVCSMSHSLSNGGGAKTSQKHAFEARVSCATSVATWLILPVVYACLKD